MTESIEARFLAQVRYVFPVRLGLDDSGYWIVHRGTPASIRVWSGRAVRELILRPVGDRNPTQQRYWLRARHPEPHDVVNREVCINEDDDLFLEEVRDAVGFTRIDVSFEAEGEVPHPEAPAAAAIRARAIEYVQRFFRTYRVVAAEADVFVPLESESPVTEVAVSTRYQFSRDECAGEFRRLSRQFQWTLPALTGVIKPRLSDDKVRLLVDDLARGTEPALFNELLLEARFLSRVQANHPLSVVVAQTAFEAYLQWRLLTECRERMIRQLKDSRGNLADVEQATADGDLRRELLGCYAKELAGPQVKDCREYQVWYEKAYMLRHESVHRARRDVSEDQARETFDAVVNYANYLDRLLTQTRGT